MKMNKIFSDWVFLLAIAYICSSRGAVAQTVKITHENGYNFRALKRFEWQDNHLLTARSQDDNRTLDRKIKRSVNQKLLDRGMLEVQENPDFYIFYQAGILNETADAGSSPSASDLQSDPTGRPAASPWGDGATSSAGFAPSVWYALQGQIEFSILESRSKTVIWHGTAVKTWRDVQKARKNEDREINQIIDKIFKDFPPKK